MLNETAKLLGFENEIEIKDGCGTVKFRAANHHLNSHGTIHGGILYAVSEEAVGQYVYASGHKGVGMDGSIKFYRPAVPGDMLTVRVTERKVGRRVGVYAVEIFNQSEKLLADSVFTIMFA